MSCSYPVPYWEYAQWLCEGFYYACWSVIFIAHFDNLIIKGYRFLSGNIHSQFLPMVVFPQVWGKKQREKQFTYSG